MTESSHMYKPRHLSLVHGSKSAVRTPSAHHEINHTPGLGNRSDEYVPGSISRSGNKLPWYKRPIVLAIGALGVVGGLMVVGGNPGDKVKDVDPSPTFLAPVRDGDNMGRIAKRYDHDGDIRNTVNDMVRLHNSTQVIAGNTVEIPMSDIDVELKPGDIPGTFEPKPTGPDSNS